MNQLRYELRNTDCSPESTAGQAWWEARASRAETMHGLVKDWPGPQCVDTVLWMSVWRE